MVGLPKAFTTNVVIDLFAEPTRRSLPKAHVSTNGARAGYLCFIFYFYSFVLEANFKSGFRFGVKIERGRRIIESNGERQSVKCGRGDEQNVRQAICHEGLTNFSVQTDPFWQEWSTREMPNKTSTNEYIHNGRNNETRGVEVIRVQLD